MAESKVILGIIPAYSFEKAVKIRVFVCSQFPATK